MGSDDNSGRIEAPFRTIQHAADLMQAGDICFIRGGRYEESIKIDNLKGKKQKPIIFTAYKNESSLENDLTTLSECKNLVIGFGTFGLLVYF